MYHLHFTNGMNTIYIKHMVCERCIFVVKQELSKLGFAPVAVSLGKATFDRDLSNEEILSIKANLGNFGFELINDKKVRFTEQVKHAIIELVNQGETDRKANLSDYLADKLHLEYSYISNVFSDLENVTIEQYYIAQRVEKVKEMLVYDEYTLTEIADKMNYSSVAYLSAQFKRITGFTPTQFKNIKGNKRTPIDKVL